MSNEWFTWITLKGFDFCFTLFLFLFGQLYNSPWGEIPELTSKWNEVQKVANVFIFKSSVAISLSDVDINKFKCEWKVLKGAGRECLIVWALLGCVVVLFFVYSTAVACFSPTVLLPENDGTFPARMLLNHSDLITSATYCPFELVDYFNFSLLSFNIMPEQHRAIEIIFLK